MNPSAPDSPLMRLPAELRLQIFEYVLCGNTIHIGVRKPHPGEPGGYTSYPGEPLIKLMHTICECERPWSEAYQMSRMSQEPDQDKHFDDRGFLRSQSMRHPDILNSYYIDHRHCNSVLHDFQWQDYMSFAEKQCRCPFPCPHYFQYQQDMIDRFGPAPQGLQIKHASSKYSLALLQVCRKIHDEAYNLPYAGNTFAFQNRWDMDLFFDNVLGKPRLDVIQRINICIRSLVRPTLPGTIPAGLKVLECYVVNDDGHFWPEIVNWQHRFDQVEAISGWDGRRSITEDSRAIRRSRACQLEIFLTKQDKISAD